MHGPILTTLGREDGDDHRSETEKYRRSRPVTAAQPGNSDSRSTKRHRPSYSSHSSSPPFIPASLSSSPPPRVLLLDMDGTMIGKITPQVCEYEVLMATQKSKLKSMKSDLVERLRQGIIRPYLASLCALIKKGEIRNVETYVYTASESKWANFLVPCIEEAIGFKFNRPIFTRNHCVTVGQEYKKSLGIVFPSIYRKLKTKYKLVDVRSLSDNMILVDNNHTVLLNPAKDGRRLVKCPTYNFAYYYDVLGRVDLPVLHAKYQRLIPILVSNYMFPDVRPSEVHSVQQFVFMYYHKMYENAKVSWREENSANISNGGKEKLFKLLLQTFKDQERRDSNYGFTEEIVATLNRHVTEMINYTSALPTSSVSSSRAASKSSSIPSITKKKTMV
jgi:hypothetical protein